MDKTIINPYEQLDLKIYAYTLPEVPSHDGYVKVGDTTRETKNVFLSKLEQQGLIQRFYLKREPSDQMEHGFMTNLFIVFFN